MKYLLSALLFLISFNGFGQMILVKGHILNEKKEPLIYSSIECVGKKRGVLTDSIGFFSLEVCMGDSLLISCLGYLPVFVVVKNTPFNITLKQNIRQLPEIILHSSSRSDDYIGCKDDKPTKGGGFSIKVGHIIAYHILPEKDNLKNVLDKISLYINSEGIKETPFRIRVFSSLGIVSEDLLQESVIVTPTKKDKWINIDLIKFKIEVPPNGIFIGIEYIEDKPEFYYESLVIRNGKTVKVINYGNKITGTWESSKNFTWLKHLGDAWYQQKFNLNGKYLNLAIRAYLTN